MSIDNEGQKPQQAEYVSLRRTNPGAERWLGVVTPVLDHGFVQLTNYMGDDRTIEEAARVSYGEGTRKINETEGLLRYLMRHQHTTPYEMCEVAFKLRLPISVARQLIRHRTANVNEISSRYSVVTDEFYIPDIENINVQSSTNRQGRGSEVDSENANNIRDKMTQLSQQSHYEYRLLLNDDGTGHPIDEDRPMLARELARDVLPLNTYTEMIWKVDLHNLFRFLGLRMDPHAQWEIRQFANAMADVVRDAFPISFKAFEDYQLNGTKISRPERDVLAIALATKGVVFTKGEILQMCEQSGLTNSREKTEFMVKLEKIGIKIEE